MRSLLAVGLLISTPAMAADQFDLVCTTKEGQTRYRVDLARNEACEGLCDRVWTMGPPSSGELKLIYKTPKSLRDLDERATVNRVTGDYQYSNTIPGLGTQSESGHCEAAPFSGFPATKF